LKQEATGLAPWYVTYQYLDGEERNEYKLVTASKFRGGFKLKARAVK